MGGNQYLDDDSSETSSIDSQLGDIHEIVRTANLLDVKKAISLDRPRLIALKDELGRQVLHYAAEFDRVKVALFLISKNADLNALDTKHQTPLILAAIKGLTNMCRFLLDFNANLHITDVDGWTALHHAVNGNFFDTAVLLIKRGSNLKVQDYQYGRTVLHLAAELGYADIVKMLLMRGSNLLGIGDDLFAKSPLHYACDNNHLEVMKILLQHGANPNLLCGLIDQTPLHVTAQKGLVDATHLLLQYRAEINIIGANTNGYSPLHLACEHNQWNIVELLLQFGADINLPGKYTILGKTPLHVACLVGQLQIVHLLCNQGLATTTNSSLVHQNHVGSTNGTSAKSGLGTGGSGVSSATGSQLVAFTPNASALSSTTTLTNVQENRLLDLNIQDEHGYTPLHIACMQGYYDIAFMLLDYGANTNIRSYGHKYALDFVTQPMLKHQMQQIIQTKLQQSIHHKVTEQYQQRLKEQEAMQQRQQELIAKQQALQKAQFEEMQKRKFLYLLGTIVKSSGEVNALEMLWEGVQEGNYQEQYINEKLYIYEQLGVDEKQRKHERYASYKPYSSQYRSKDGSVQGNLVSITNGTEVLGSSVATIYNNPAYQRPPIDVVTGGVLDEGVYTTGSVFSLENYPITSLSPRKPMATTSSSLALLEDKAGLDGYGSTSMVLYQPDQSLVSYGNQSLVLANGSLLDGGGAGQVVGIGNPTNYYTFAIVHAAMQGFYSLMEVLLVWPGINLNAQDSEGNTALHYAASNNHADIVELLLLHHVKTTLFNKAGKLAANMTNKLFLQDLIRNPDKVQKKYQYQQMVSQSLPAIVAGGESDASTTTKKKLFPTLTAKAKEQNIYDIILPTNPSASNTNSTKPTKSSLPSPLPSSSSASSSMKKAEANAMDEIITAKYNLLVTKEIVAFNEQHYNPLKANPSLSASLVLSGTASLPAIHGGSGNPSRPRTSEAILEHSLSLPALSRQTTSDALIRSASTKLLTNSGDTTSIQTIDPVLLDKYGPLPTTFRPSQTTSANDFFHLPPPPPPPSSSSTTGSLYQAFPGSHRSLSSASDSLTHGTSLSYFTYLSQKKSQYFQDVYTLQSEYPPSVFDSTDEYLDIIDTLWLVGHPYYYYYKNVYTEYSSSSSHDTDATPPVPTTNSVVEALYLEKIIMVCPTHAVDSFAPLSEQPRPIERYDMRIIGYQLSKLLTMLQEIYCTPARLFTYPSYVPNTITSATNTMTTSTIMSLHKSSSILNGITNHDERYIGAVKEHSPAAIVREYTDEEMSHTEDSLFTRFRQQFPKNIHLLDLWRLEWYGYCCFEYLTLYLASYEYDSIQHLLAYYELRLPSMSKLNRKQSEEDSMKDNNAQAFGNSNKGSFQWGSIFLTKLFVFWYCAKQGEIQVLTQPGKGNPITDNVKPPLPSAMMQSMSKEEYSVLLQWYVAYSELLHHYATLLSSISQQHALSTVVYESLQKLLQHCSLFHFTTSESNNNSLPKKSTRKEKDAEGDNESDLLPLLPMDPLYACWSPLVLNPPRSFRNTIDCLFELSQALVKYAEHYYSQDIIRTHLWKFALKQLFTQQSIANHYYQQQLPSLLNTRPSPIKEESSDQLPETNPSTVSFADSGEMSLNTGSSIVQQQTMSPPTPHLQITPLQLWLHDLQLLSYEPYFTELGFKLLEDFQELNDEDCHLYFPFLKIGDMRRMKKNINELDDRVVAGYVKKVQKMNKPKTVSKSGSKKRIKSSPNNEENCTKVGLDEQQAV